MLTQRVKTPCIGVCSTGIGDEVCRGCKRYTHEIINWNSYSLNEKVSVLKRLDKFLAQVIEPKIVIDDCALLEQQMTKQQLRFDRQRSPYSWLFDLLKAGSSQIADLKEFGCVIQPDWKGRTLPDIRDIIDADFFVLSSVHYERYFMSTNLKADLENQC